MSLKRIWNALRGATNEGLEAVADSQSMRILDQEMRDAKTELEACDRNLTTIMAKRKLAQTKVESISADIDTYTQHAIAASEKADEALALECAERVSNLEVQLATEQEIYKSYLGTETSLKTNIAKAKASVKRLSIQIDQVKATESLQKAQVAGSSHHVGANSKVKTALDSLERIKEKQALRSAELSAAEELAAEDSGSSLDEKLKQAGIESGGQSTGSDKLKQILAQKQAK